MEVYFSPDLQAKVDKWTADTGRPASELVQDVIAEYFESLAEVRGLLDSRYADLRVAASSPSTAKQPLPA